MKGGEDVELDKINLLIIDPQVDFHEGGNLAVAGANGDSQRIAGFIEANQAKLNKVFVSLDTHTPNHIGHQKDGNEGYWVVLNEDGTPAQDQTITPFTVFAVKDGAIIEAGVENPRKFKPKRKELLDWTIEYIKEVPTFGKGPPLIWPTHCIEDQPGHAVQPQLKETLDKLDTDMVEYHIKGQNEATEMYSIFKAEIPTETINNGNKDTYYSGTLPLKTSSKIDAPRSDVPDGAYLQTTFNNELYNSLTSEGKPIVICGEALTHCVNWSLRDLVDKILKGNEENYVDIVNLKLKDNKVVLLLNASSAIPNFDENTTVLLKYCEEKNVRIGYVDVDHNYKITTEL